MTVIWDYLKNLNLYIREKVNFINQKLDSFHYQRKLRSTQLNRERKRGNEKENERENKRKRTKERIREREQKRE